MWLLIHPKRGGTIRSQLGRGGGQLTDGERGTGNGEQGTGKREKGKGYGEGGEPRSRDTGMPWNGEGGTGKGEREKGKGGETSANRETGQPGFREAETRRWRSNRGENAKRRSTDDTPLRPYGSRVFSHASMLRSKLAGYVATMSPVGDT